MTLKKRFALIFAGIVIFFIFAPTAIFFALGYRYDFENNRIIQTGAVLIRTQPKKAAVVLNNEKKGKTPLTQRFLVPGEYKLEVSKPGYYTWKKDITIHKKQALEVTTSNLNKIFMLLSDTKPQIIQEQNSGYFSNKTDLYLLKTAKQQTESTLLEIEKIDKQGNSTVTAQSNEDYDSPVIADALGGEILLKDNNQFIYLTNDFLSFLPTEHSDYRLGIRPESVLGLDEDNNLLSFDLRGEVADLLAENIEYYEVINNEIYLISDKGGLLNLSKISPSGLKTPLHQNLNPSSSYDIITDGKGRVFLLTDRTLFRLTENGLDQLKSNTTFAKFGISASHLIYGNLNEVWIHYPKRPTNNSLITRQSEPLLNPLLNEEIGYIFIGKGNTLTAYELSSDNQKNIYQLAETEKPTIPIFATKSEIYYKSGNSVYKIRVVED